MKPIDPYDLLGRPDRRHFLKLAALAGMSWLTPLGQMLARAAEKQKDPKEPAYSVIVLWMQGGPSQLETFDPKPGTEIAGGTQAIETTVKEIQLAEGFGRLAEQMEHVSLIRSVVSKEGDHERGTYTLKTGYRPDPTVIHPSIGAVCCHELPVEGPWGKTEIPRHVSLLPNQWSGRGGYLGDQYDAFRCVDPAQKVPDITARVPAKRDEERVKDLDIVEKAFARGRGDRVKGTLHSETIQAARTMMSSEQLKAFEIDREPAKLREAYGDTPFGRSCLAARRLTEVGVRCVEVTLGSWDTHVDNHKQVKPLIAALDPAFAALIRDLKERDLLRKTVVLCMGEFGRTPRINSLGGRDHWPNGFSIAIAGGGLRGGQVIGETDPEGKPNPADPVNVGDIHATVLNSLGIDYQKVMTSPIGRTVKLTEGQPLRELLPA